jgi:hypothetical protein
MHLIALIVFFAATLLGAWFIVGEIISGQTANRNSVVERADNPGGFWLLITVKSAFVVFGVAVLLHVLGLIGNPYAWLHATFPALFRR